MDSPAVGGCPACGAVGRRVGEETLQAILAPAQAAPLLAAARRFCRTPSCGVVYYGEDGRTVNKPDVPIRVGVKETQDPIPICYCFGFSRADVRAELAAGGRCTIPDRIGALIQAGRCACAIKNPAGNCCLGEVNRVVEEERWRIDSTSR